MLSSPRGLGFVLAVVIGAMLVPGCRAERRVNSRSERAANAPAAAVGKPESRPGVLPAAGSAGRPPL